MIVFKLELEIPNIFGLMPIPLLEHNKSMLASRHVVRNVM